MSTEPVFNPPPGWPRVPEGWIRPAGWVPDPSWPAPPDGWQLWLTPDGKPVGPESSSEAVAAESSAAAPSGFAAPSVVDHHKKSAEMIALEAENSGLKKLISELESSDSAYVELNDDRVLQNVGIYRYHHPLETAVQFQDRLSQIQSGIAEVVKSDKAIVKSNMFTFDNSLAKGRRMTDDLGKLMLRAYNSEVDNSIRSLKAGNVLTAKKRVDATRVAIARLGRMMEMRISDAFHDLRIEEIELTSDWLMKKQEEREIERENRAALREQRKVEQELAEERDRLDKERAHLVNALGALEAAGSTDPELQNRLAQLDDAIAQNDYRVANIRAGYVYVISNVGAFGPGVVKIGLTRRLEPIDRVNELGGASVPFRFDVHTLYFSEDAVTLENELHKHFALRALNLANSRKEFFFATPAEVRAVLEQKVGNLLEYKEAADATEYFQSVRSWPQGRGEPELLGSRE